MGLPGISKGSSAAPGSSHDNALRRAAGWPGVVYRLRYNGHFLPGYLILRRPAPEGLVVCTHDTQAWRADLHPKDGSPNTLLRSLIKARPIKDRDDGCVLIGGLEWDEGYIAQWPQTWLCAPSDEVGVKLLQKMDGWLRARYPGRD